MPDRIFKCIVCERSGWPEERGHHAMNRCVNCWPKPTHYSGPRQICERCGRTICSNERDRTQCAECHVVPKRWAKTIRRCRCGNRYRPATSRQRWCREPGCAPVKLHPRAVHDRQARSLGTHTEDEWQTLLATSGHRCTYCRRRGPMTKDHITPVSRGGSDAIENITPACRSCNSAKGNLDVHLFIARHHGRKAHAKPIHHH